MDRLKLLETSIRAALAAGEKILDVYESDDFDVSLKDDDSPLTRADLISQKTISEILAVESIPILGEEGDEVPYSERSNWQTFWLVDPLDGTKEFIKRNGEFTVNIALVENRRSTIGALYVPVKDTLYFAAVGKGAYIIEKARTIEPSMILDKAIELPLKKDRTVPPVVVVASRSHYSEETAAYVESIKEKYGKVELVNAGSALKICLVAEGRADIYPRIGPTMEWDVAAGQIIAEEAGCTLVSMDTGESLCYNKENLLNPYFVVSGKLE